MIKKILKENWIFLLFVLVASLIGGYCTGLYVYDTLSPDMLNRLQEQNVSKNLLVISTLLQYGVVFGGILAFIGLIISKKVNLWKEFKYDKQAIVMTAVITVASALILFPGDKLIFESLNSWVYEQYEAAPAISKILAGLLTGGVTEEIIMRLFLMSLLVLIASKVMLMENKDIPEKVHIVVNVIVALLFAAGHLPSTMAMTTLTPLIVLRCFLFNGGIGLAFGYLYRKFGIFYAMIAHGAAHLIADILLAIFI